MEWTADRAASFVTEFCVARQSTERHGLLQSTHSAIECLMSYCARTSVQLSGAAKRIPLHFLHFCLQSLRILGD